VTFFMMHTWKDGCLLRGQLALEAKCWASWRRALSPSWHGHTWFPAWRLIDLRMVGFQSDHLGGVDQEEHMA
jgi:hypothetical protein